MSTSTLDIPALTHDLSPLAQVRRASGIGPGMAVAGLNPSDQQTLRQVLEQKYEYVHDKALFQAQAERKIFDEAPPIAKPDTTWYHPVMDSVSDRGLSAGNTGSVLLTAAQERVLFHQFNYCRMRVCKLREEIHKQGGRPDPASARLILDWHARADGYRQQIAQTNLALVLAMAKRVRMGEVDFADLVSEGNMALLRAVDKFDVSRGFKFSTYACRAILKAFSRIGVKQSKYRQVFPTDFDPKLEKSDYMTRKRETHEGDCVDELQHIIKENRADLTDIEKEVIERRFAVGRHRRPAEETHTPLTLEQVGKIIGVTKERVRQIQNKALEKIRQTLENNFLG